MFVNVTLRSEAYSTCSQFTVNMVLHNNYYHLWKVHYSFTYLISVKTETNLWEIFMQSHESQLQSEERCEDGLQKHK